MMARTYWRTLKRCALSLLTISAMMAIGYTTRYSGLDATLGLAFAQTGFLYPFFGTMLGWLGVALTGSTRRRTCCSAACSGSRPSNSGSSPVLMAAANSSGGVMGKMIDAQSIVVASTATRWFGHEGEILRYVFCAQRRPRMPRGAARVAAGVRRAVHRARQVTGPPMPPSGCGRSDDEVGS